MTSDVDRLLAAFDAGTLLRPAADVANSVDLAHALAAACGVPDTGLTPGAHEISELIGDVPHLVFVLVDGLGLDAVGRLPEGGFLRTHVALELRALFPTSTAPVLTSLATGLWPGEHGITGWWSYLPKYGVTATVLPFTERFSHRPLAEFGVDPADVLRRPSRVARYRYAPVSYLPAGIAGSIYSRYSSGDTEVRGYAGISSAFDAVGFRVATAKEPSFTYLHLPQYDAAAHEAGPKAPRAMRVLRRIDAMLVRFAARLPAGSRVVVSADHGVIGTPRSSVVALAPDDALMSMLLAPPDGDGRAPRFHLRAGAEGPFWDLFRARFGDRFALLTVDEAERLRLYGPEPIAVDVRERFGNLQGIPLGDSVLVYGGDAWLPGNHGGLSPEEMRVPLVVA